MAVSRPLPADLTTQRTLLDDKGEAERGLAAVHSEVSEHNDEHTTDSCDAAATTSEPPSKRTITPSPSQSKQTIMKDHQQDDFALSTSSSSSSSIEIPRQYGPGNGRDFAMDPYLLARMNNADPTNEFMYQMPIQGGTMKQSSETQIDAEALKARLQTLGLQHPSTSALPLDDAEPELVTPPDDPYLPRKDPLRRFPTVHEIHPDDSISMYRPQQQARHSAVGRKGGTDVDPGEAPGGYEDDMRHPENFSVDGGVTMNTPRSMAYLEPTLGPASVITRGTYGAPGMQAMRDKLMQEQADEEAARVAQMTDTARLASAITKLETTEDQLRTLQATLIAERVHRSKVERDASLNAHDVRDIKEELASAVRALRRARDEGRRSEEDKRAITRAYEVAQAKINQYQLELSIREALNRGREKGRQEAWDEAAKWMGSNPPLPVDPVRHIPETVFGRTPINGSQQLPQQYAQQQHQHLQSPPQGFGQTPSSGQQGYQSMPLPDSNPSSQQQQHGSGSGPPGSGGMASDPSQHGLGRPQQGHSLAQQMSHGQSDMPMLQHTGQSVHQQQPFGGQSMQPQHTGAQRHQTSQAMQPQPPMQAPIPGYPQSGNGLFSSIPQGGQQSQSRSVPQQYASLPQQQQPQRAATVIDPSRRHVSQPPPARHDNHAADEYLDRVEHDHRVQDMLKGTRTKSVPTSQYPPTDPHDKPLPEPFTPHTQARTHRPSVSGTNNGRSRRRQSLSEGMHPSMMMHSIPDGDRYPAFPGAQPHGGLSHVGHQRGHSRNTSLGSVDPAAYALPASTIHSLHNTPQAFQRQPASTVHTANKTAHTSGGDVRSRMADALRTGQGMEPARNLSQIEEEDLAAQRMTMPPQQDREREFSQSTIMRNANETPQQPRRFPSMPPPKHQPRPVMPGMLSGKSASEIHAPTNRTPRGPRPSQSAVGTGPRGDDPPFSHPMFVPPGMAPVAVSGGVEDIQGPRHSALGLEGIEAQSGGANALGHGMTGGYGGTKDSSERGGLGGFLSNVMKAPTITVQPPSSRSKSNVPSQIPSAKAPSADPPPVPIPAPPPLTANSDRITQAVTEKKDASHDPPLISRQTVTTTEIFQDAAAAASLPAAVKSIKAHDIPLPRSRAGTVTTVAAPHDVSVGRSRAPTMTNEPAASKEPRHGQLPHEIPLPHSRAPTVMSTFAPPPTAQHPSQTQKTTKTDAVDAHHVPLPKSRSHAPTAYDAPSPDLLSPRTERSGRSHGRLPAVAPVVLPPGMQNPFGAMPNVSVIDFALNHALAKPLPESRATTMYGSPPHVSPPEQARGAVDNAASKAAKSAPKRKPVPASGNGNGHGNGSHFGPTDPRHVPLPASRAPTARARASTYARTEGTIDEVTEEESGRENQGEGRKRW